MTATDTGAALLRAILDDPAGDTARLVFADWLQGEGEGERAEFIRLQIALASGRLKCRRTDGRSCGQCRACDASATVSIKALMLSPPGWHGSTRDEPNELTRDQFMRFARGFVSEITCHPASWAKDGAAILAQHPVQTIRFPEFTARIHAPKAQGEGWHIDFFEEQTPESGWVNAAPTRKEMVDRLMQGVRDLEGELA